MSLPLTVDEAEALRRALDAPLSNPWCQPDAVEIYQRVREKLLGKRLVIKGHPWLDPDKGEAP